MARTPAGLTDEQVTHLRSALRDNKRPRVTVAGQQFGGETTGLVVTVGDVESEGPEFIQVRVKLDGLTDVLRFAPQELRLPQRGRPTQTARMRAAEPAPQTVAPATATAELPVPSTAPARAVKTAAAQAAATPKPAAARPVPVDTTGRPPAPLPSDPPAAKPGARGRRALVRPPAVTITISSSGADWTLSANRGGRAVLKSVPMSPGSVATVVELLAQPALVTAVEEVNGAALSLAQQRADELRSELAAVEFLLAAYRSSAGR